MEKLLKELEINEKVLLARFGGNRQLVMRFLKKFPQDKTFEQLCTAVEKKDYPVIETTAHTLKGVSANLELKVFCQCNTKIVEAVRAERYDEIPDLFVEEKKEYQRITECISRYVDTI